MEHPLFIALYPVSDVFVHVTCITVPLYPAFTVSQICWKYLHSDFTLLWELVCIFISSVVLFHFFVFGVWGWSVFVVHTHFFSPPIFTVCNSRWTSRIVFMSLNIHLFCFSVLYSLRMPKYLSLKWTSVLSEACCPPIISQAKRYVNLECTDGFFFHVLPDWMCVWPKDLIASWL